MQLSRYFYMSTEYIRGFLFLLLINTVLILMLRQILPSDDLMLFQIFSLCFSTWPLPASENRFIFKNRFHDLTISSKQNGFIHFQCSNKTALHAHFVTITVLLLFHVFQHCNVTVLVLLFLLVISSWPKVKPYKLDSVMGENGAQAHRFVLFSFVVVVIVVILFI